MTYSFEQRVPSSVDPVEVSNRQILVVTPSEEVFDSFVKHRLYVELAEIGGLSEPHQDRAIIEFVQKYGLLGGDPSVGPKYVRDIAIAKAPGTTQVSLFEDIPAIGESGYKVQCESLDYIKDISRDFYNLMSIYWALKSPTRNRAVRRVLKVRGHDVGDLPNIYLNGKLLPSRLRARESFNMAVENLDSLDLTQIALRYFVHKSNKALKAHGATFPQYEIVGGKITGGDWQQRHLIGALYIQFYEETAADRPLTQCIKCDKPFMPKEKSKDSYCSDQCSAAFRKRIERKKNARDEFDIDSPKYKELDDEVNALEARRKRKGVISHGINHEEG